MFKDLFQLRKPLDKKTSLILGIGGIVFLLAVWIILSTPFLDNPDYMDPVAVEAAIQSGEIENEPNNNPEKIALVPRSSLPHPMRVLTAFGDLYRDNELIQNAAKSIGLNIGGYIKAIIWSLPLGFIIGLIPLFRGSFQRVVNAIRFIPLTAVTVLFIVWFGIGVPMKVNFLAFGIMIYLLPVIVQRIDEVNEVYLKTVYTLGANAWQTVLTVYIPSVLSRLSDDIRILTAISWTYIIVAETSGDQGGLGSLIYRAAQRMGRIDKTFAILILIILIGVFQDRVFAYLDRKFFAHKYQTKKAYQKVKYLKEESVFDTIMDFTINIISWIFLAIYLILAVNEFTGFLGGKILSTLFGDTVWAIHTVFLSIIVVKIYKLATGKKSNS